MREFVCADCHEEKELHSVFSRFGEGEIVI